METFCGENFKVIQLYLSLGFSELYILLLLLNMSWHTCIFNICEIQVIISLKIAINTWECDFVVI